MYVHVQTHTQTHITRMQTHITYKNTRMIMCISHTFTHTHIHIHIHIGAYIFFCNAILLCSVF